MAATLDPSLGLAVFLGACGMSFADAAAAAHYTCQVPLAVLCQNCVSDVTISLQPRGGCRVSFIPAPGGVTQPVSGTITLEIQTPAPPAFPRRGVFLRARRLAQPFQRPSHPCFVFNDRQYCE